MSIETSGATNPEFEFGDRIRKVRRSIARLDQAGMADALGVTRQAYAAWEDLRTKPSDIVAVAKLAESIWAGRVTASWLLGIDEGPPSPYQGPPSPLRTRLNASRKNSPYDRAGTYPPVDEGTRRLVAA